MRPTPAIALACATLLLTACRETTVAESIELTASVEQQAFVPPDVLTIRVRAFNPTSKRLEFHSHALFPLWAEVRTADGTPVYGHLRGGPDVIPSLSIEPQDSVVLETTWNGSAGDASGSPVSPGTYEVVARLAGREGRRTSEPVTVTVLPATP